MSYAAQAILSIAGAVALGLALRPILHRGRK